jgi:oleate hydratase
MGAGPLTAVNRPMREANMVAHIVGAGLASLSAAVYLIKDAGVPGGDIFLYEARDQLGGAMASAGGPESGYVLPTGRVFERNFRCAFELFSLVPSASDPGRSVLDEIEEFHRKFPYDDRGRLIDRQGTILKSPHFGLRATDTLEMIRLALTPEDWLDGKRIEEFFSPEFFKSEFWLLWTTLMNSLPQHSAMEFRRFMLRFLEVLPHLSDMQTIYRTPVNQQEAIVVPIVKWLRSHGVHFLPGALVTDVALRDDISEVVATSLSYVFEGGLREVRLDVTDILLITNGSQVADLALGSMTEPPKLNVTGRAWALWERMSRGRDDLGNPGVFFGEGSVSDSKWVTFTVTTTDPTFLAQMEKLTGSETGRGGLTTFADSDWLITVSIFHQPEFVGQPEGVSAWWGYALYPDKTGSFVRKPLSECSGAEVLMETAHHAGLGAEIDRIVASSICIPCLLPFAGSVWRVRRRGDRPSVVPSGARNFGFIGQFSEVAEEAIFAMEYSVRSAREAVAKLCGLDIELPPVYQGQKDAKALFAAANVLLA